MAGVVQKDEEGPLRRLALQCGERAVRQGEPAPKRRRQPQDVTEYRPKRPLVGGDEGRFPPLHDLIEYAARPSCQRSKILAAGGAAELPPVDPGAPVLPKPAGHLLAGQPFPTAVMAFTETGRLLDGNPLRLLCGNDPGRLPGSFQIARIDRLQIDGGQPLGKRTRLQSSPLIERDVGLPLNPLVQIPLRFAVTNQIND
jgi:hypothetical protein